MADDSAKHLEVALVAAERTVWQGQAKIVIARTTDGTVGAAALRLQTGQLVSLNGDEPFPLASVCKLPIAIHMLALVDEGKFGLQQEIEVLPRDIVSSVSNIARRWPGQRRFPLSEMIELKGSDAER